MAWQDRLREAAYTSPGGTRIRFAYEAVRREVEKRTTAFSFPGVDGAYVQDNGHGARSYPLRCYFSGDDHDLEATAFEAALLERGVGRLEHPLYGTFDVVPFGDITRRDDLRDAANQSVVEVTFFTTLETVYPRIQADPRSEVLAALDAFDVALAQQFEDSIDLSTTVARAHVQTRFQAFLGEVSAELTRLSQGTAAIRREFADAQQEVHLGIDVLIGQPLQLAKQVANLIKAPARANAGIRSRLEGYAALAVRIMTSPPAMPWEAFAGGVVLPGRRRQVANDFHGSIVFGTSAVAGAVLSTVETTFTSRPAAIGAAETILDEADGVVDWMDTGFAALADADPSELDTGEAYQALQHAVAVAAGYLVQLSFSLLPERRIVLDRPRTIIDLAAELYGSVDDRLDLLIESNGLTGSEILELPRGRTIVYYA